MPPPYLKCNILILTLLKYWNTTLLNIYIYNIARKIILKIAAIVAHGCLFQFKTFILDLQSDLLYHSNNPNQADSTCLYETGYYYIVSLWMIDMY
jgi:hypothetical protein